MDGHLSEGDGEEDGPMMDQKNNNMYDTQEDRRFKYEMRQHAQFLLLFTDSGSVSVNGLNTSV